MAEPGVRLVDVADTPSLLVVRSFEPAPGLEDAPAPGRSGRLGGAVALGLAPLEWMLVGSAEVPVSDERTTTLDVTAARRCFRLTGPAAGHVLNMGSTVDLRPRRFPSGACAQTTVGGIPVVLWRCTDDDELWLCTWRSFADALRDWLVGAVAVTADAAAR